MLACEQLEQGQGAHAHIAWALRLQVIILQNKRNNLLQWLDGKAF